jgi:hypothetical protein
VNTRARLEMIRADCKADAARPLIEHLSTPTVGELRYAVSSRHGEMLAMIDALAASMLEQQDMIEQVALACDQREAWRVG